MTAVALLGNYRSALHHRANEAGGEEKKPSSVMSCYPVQMDPNQSVLSTKDFKSIRMFAYPSKLTGEA